MNPTNASAIVTGGALAASAPRPYAGTRRRPRGLYPGSLL